MNEDQTLMLTDGRALGYAEYGDLSGKPIFLFHGSPGTRHVGKITNVEAEGFGLRVICPDRPGFGLSDVQPGRRIADWPTDVTALADALSLDRFGVVGVSGGGPYAAACARYLPDRITKTALVSGVGPLDAPGATDGMSRQNRIIFAMSGRIPRVVGVLTASMMKRAKRDPKKMIARMKQTMPEVDQAVLDRPDVAGLLLGDPGPDRKDAAKAIAQESALLVGPWGFELREIRGEVHLYQGELDQNVPPSMGRFQAAQIPNCVAHFHPDEGHLSLMVNHLEDFLSLFA